MLQFPRAVGDAGMDLIEFGFELEYPVLQVETGENGEAKRVDIAGFGDRRHKFIDFVCGPEDLFGVSRYAESKGLVEDGKPDRLSFGRVVRPIHANGYSVRLSS
jgi:hypothetical protein